ncbi:hypothetical protein Lser_V15G11881 [Lactuca serriola]
MGELTVDFHDNPWSNFSPIPSLSLLTKISIDSFRFSPPSNPLEDSMLISAYLFTRHDLPLFFSTYLNNDIYRGDYS